MMFVVPIKITKERQDEFKQTYILSETMYLVDNVRNTRMLSKEMYDIYADKVTSMINNAKIEMLSSDLEYNNFLFASDIFESFKISGGHEFSRYDYFKIIVYENDVPIAYYGGSVK